MKLLLDENLSRRLVPALQVLFPGTSQVALLGMERATDVEVCEYAAQHGFVIVTKDDDFQRLVLARGYRPKLVHVALGNATNDTVLEALLAAAARLEEAFADPEVGVVTLRGKTQDNPAS